MKFPDQFRVNPSPAYTSMPGSPFGCFVIPDKCDRLLCIVSSGSEAPQHGLPPWEHVSVTVRNRKMEPLRRCPTWEQMCIVKDLFWDEAQAVMQLHPPKAEHVNTHAFCLHLWRAVDQAIPLPPSIMVGIKGFSLVK